jgi:hypothetical protein
MNKIAKEEAISRINSTIADVSASMILRKIKADIRHEQVMKDMREATELMQMMIDDMLEEYAPAFIELAKSDTQ